MGLRGVLPVSALINLFDSNEYMFAFIKVADNHPMLMEESALRAGFAGVCWTFDIYSR